MNNRKPESTAPRRGSMEAQQRGRRAHPRHIPEISVCYMDAGDAINEADIQLICAARDLLRALLGLFEQIESLKGESSCDEDIMQGAEYRNARTAVAKATG